MENPKPTIIFTINSMLLLLGIAAALSGLTIMLHYHMSYYGAV